MASRAPLIIIQNRLIMMLKLLENEEHASSIPASMDLLEAYNHDIQDCLYWMKKENENDE